MVQSVFICPAVGFQISFYGDVGSFSHILYESFRFFIKNGNPHPDGVCGFIFAGFSVKADIVYAQRKTAPGFSVFGGSGGDVHSDVAFEFDVVCRFHDWLLY